MENTKKGIASNRTKELAMKFVNCKMNNSIDYNPTKILKLLGSNFSKIYALKNHFIDEKARMEKEFSKYYTSNINEILDELIEEAKKHYDKVNSIWSLECSIGHIIITALKEGTMFIKFNWGNYNMLVENGLSNFLSDFNSNFRGDIVKCHKVNNKYVVIETECYPFDFNKQKYKLKEPKEKQFYSTEIRKGIVYITNNVFGKFELALFDTMAPSQCSAISILFEAANK